MGMAPPGTIVQAPMIALPETGPLNVFVGKLPSDLSDHYVRNLLEKCGLVVSWKRTTDPVTKKPKGFGYCTYAGAMDVLRAVRLLNGFSVDSKQILVKVDAKTQVKLDEYTAAMTEKMKLEAQATDEEVRKVLKALEDERSGLMGGIQNHPASWGDLLGKNGDADAGQGGASNGDADTDETNAEGEAAPPAGKQVQQKMILSEIEKFRLAQDQREQDMEQKRRESVRERLRQEREEEEKRKAAKEQPEPAKEPVSASSAPEPVEEKVTPAVEKVKDENANGPNRQDRERDRSHPRDKERDRDRDRDRDRARDRDRDRDRRKRARSRSRSRSRERSSRRRRRSYSRSRSRSRGRDRRDRDRDRERDRDRRRRRRRRSSTGDESSDDDRRSKRRKGSHASDGKRDDEEKSKAEEPKKTAPKMMVGMKLSIGAPKKEKSLALPAAPVFKMEEVVEVKPVRAIIPIDYTDEERKASGPAGNVNGDVKSLIDQIPTDKDGLFAYHINWSAVDKHKIVEDKMIPWVRKKVLEYLGEEDKTMIDFLLKQLRAHALPQAILKELQAVLDDEAEVFVKLLWRKLAFEALRA
ncbi:hypothetical protein Poli38472_010495 [Pythium oligandrum]|uniref:RNA-binding protein 25 n=1 Tax=Pythium oligandrum TaxID=41045 RepID=A0A8K1C3C9_PYTOL|nr:hypothetical protein Poli38472_010495 [Pythium oligandrum]|eukprot:TMW55613.1 hypothetical protein Poli38472_010495 [Pythium oligandrum]